METTATSAQPQQKLIEQVQQFLQRKQMSQTDLATKLGYSPAVISQVLKGEYKGDEAQVMRKLAHEIGYSESKWEILKTSNYESLMYLCNDAQEDGTMMLAYGNTGCGKTTALKAYHAMTPNTYYILANVLMKPKDLLLAIARSIGVEVAGSLSDILDAIVDRIAALKYPLLIIDDAGKLDQHPKVFGIIQLLYDRLNGRCGIVIAGTNRLAKYISAMADKDVMGFRELKRRITYWLPLRAEVGKKFIIAVCNRYGITLPAAIAYITSNCSNYGDVHEMIKNYNKVKAKGEIPEADQADVLAGLKFNHLSV